MDDLEIIKQFIGESNFDEATKTALTECIVIEFKGGATSEYNALLKKLSGEAKG